MCCCQPNGCPALMLKLYLCLFSFPMPPSIDDALSSSDVTAREQSSVTLTCSATGTLPLTVRWRREDGKLININRTLAVTEWEGTHLDLNKVSRYDMAAYLCIASNGVPPTVIPPSVTLHQQLIGAPLGSTVSLDCTIESSPAALHFWSRSDGTDLHEAAKYLMQSSSSIGPFVTPAMAGASQPTWPSFRTQLRLTIVNVTAKDYGAYRCVAKNQYGEADGVITFHLSVLLAFRSLGDAILFPVKFFVSSEREKRLIKKSGRVYSRPKRPGAVNADNQQRVERYISLFYNYIPAASIHTSKPIWNISQQEGDKRRPDDKCNRFLYQTSFRPSTYYQTASVHPLYTLVLSTEYRVI
uniref:Ig-like domain-containing protein n=1 Tax=Daphnia galeata TaxID=27404 RepID=A0A8J2W372_9CRUS|nr:unnamed protein product [Daphnia galeata]